MKRNTTCESDRCGTFEDDIVREQTGAELEGHDFNPSTAAAKLKTWQQPARQCSTSPVGKRWAELFPWSISIRV